MLGLVRRRENIPAVTGGPSRGLPPRVYVPILLAVTLAFLGTIGYFLRIGLSETGAALGPSAQQGDANIRATAAPNEVDIPQTGGAGQGAASSALGGTPAQGVAGAPPPPVARLLGELRQRLARNPKDAAALVGLANLYSDAGKYPQALPYYERALAVAPGDADARTQFAAALHGANDDARALMELDKVLAHKPHYADALYAKGVVAANAGRRDLAVAAYRAFLRAAPADQRAGDARSALKSLGA